MDFDMDQTIDDPVMNRKRNIVLALDNLIVQMEKPITEFEHSLMLEALLLKISYRSEVADYLLSQAAIKN